MKANNSQVLRQALLSCAAALLAAKECHATGEEAFTIMIDGFKSFEYKSRIELIAVAAVITIGIVIHNYLFKDKIDAHTSNKRALVGFFVFVILIFVQLVLFK